MPVEVIDHESGVYLELRVSGKLTKDDYRQFTPLLEARIQDAGQVRLLVEMTDFQGWTAEAMWEDIKLDSRHFRDINRLAIVGDSKWQEYMTLFSRPFTTAKVRYFSTDEREQAFAWIQEGSV